MINLTSLGVKSLTGRKSGIGELRYVYNICNNIRVIMYVYVGVGMEYYVEKMIFK